METASISVLDMLCVIGFGLVGAVLSEGFAWFFVYRTEAYQSLLEDINRATKKLDSLRDGAPKSLKLSAKLKAHEAQLSKKSQTLGFMRMKAALFSSVFYFLIVPLFNSLYEGTVVARLPFQPVYFFRSLAHHGLTTFAETDCSSMYLYILSIGFFRTNLQKLLGAAPPKSATAQAGGLGSLFQLPDQATGSR